MMLEIPEIGYVMLALLALAMLLAFVRLARGPSLTDRVVAVDLITTIGVAMSALYAMLHHSRVFLDVAIFVGTIAFARYIEAKGMKRDAS
jgi:multicomponent Na+:H+ antiporter subunit F